MTRDQAADIIRKTLNQQTVLRSDWQAALGMALDALSTPPVSEVTREDLVKAYIAGFQASGEGYNGEYPFEGVELTDPRWDHVKQWAANYATPPAPETKK